MKEDISVSTKEEWDAKCRADAERDYRNFRATRKKYGKIEVLDWQNADGTAEYSVRYIFDGDENTMYVSGDLGNAVFSLTWEPCLENVWYQDADYMMEKFLCGTNSFVYPEKFIESDIKQYYAREIKHLESMDRAEAGIYLGAINDIVKNTDYNTGRLDPRLYAAVDSVMSIMDTYWAENHFGRVISPRAHYWLTGLKMAYKDLYKEKEAPADAVIGR